MTNKLRKATLYILSLIFGMTAVCGFADIDLEKVERQLSTVQERIREDKDIWPLILKNFNEENFSLQFSEESSVVQSSGKGLGALAMTCYEESFGKKRTSFPKCLLRVTKKQKEADQIIDEFCDQFSNERKFNTLTGYPIPVKSEVISKEINDEDFGKTLTLNVKMQLSPRRAVYVKNKLIITSNNVYEMMIREKKAKKNNAFFDSSTVENLKK
jgi:hypothetical protein